MNIPLLVRVSGLGGLRRALKVIEDSNLSLGPKILTINETMNSSNNQSNNQQPNQDHPDELPHPNSSTPLIDSGAHQLPYQLQKSTHSSFEQQNPHPSPISTAGTIDLPPLKKPRHVPLAENSPIPTNQNAGCNLLQPKSYSKLLQLSDEYYKHAKSNIRNIKNLKNLKEYYTLIKLSVLALTNALRDKSQFSNLLEIQINLKIAKILINDALSIESINDNSIEQDSLTPEPFLDRAILLSSNSVNSKSLHIEACVLNVRLLDSNKQFIQAINFIDNLLETSTVLDQSEAEIFQYLKYKTLSSISEQQSFSFLNELLKKGDNFQLKDLRDLLLLQQYSFCLSKNLKPITSLSDILPNVLQLKIMKYFLEIIHFLNYKDLNETTKIDEKFKELGKLLSGEKKQLSRTFFEFDYTTNMVSLTLRIDWFDFNLLNIFFTILYGIFNLNTTYEKRKSKLIFNKALEQTQNLISSFNKFTEKLNESYYNKLMLFKYLISFYQIIEVSIVDRIPIDLINDFELSHSEDNLKLFKSSYLKGIKYQLDGNLSESYKNFEIIINNKTNDKNISENSDIYLFSIINQLLILESNIQYFKRVKNSDINLNFNKEKLALVEKLNRLKNSQKFEFKNKNLVSTTIKLIELIFNYNNQTNLQIENEIEELLSSNNNNENLKKYPLLYSLLLHIKSKNLNKDSSIKQEISQSSFSFAKFGYSPLIRLISGNLNLENAMNSMNLQQVEIQKQKLSKIKTQLGGQYDAMHDHF